MKTCALPLVTPWGMADDVKELAEGVLLVNLSDRGGYMVALEYARKNLSCDAIRRGRLCNEYLCYDRYSKWAILGYELPVIVKYLSGGDVARAALVRHDILLSLSLCNADYLLERGIAPEPVAYERWKIQRERKRMLDKRDPDIIVSSFGWQSTSAEVIQVVTGDNKKHFVTGDSYRKLDFRLPLLSNCEIYKPELRSDDDTDKLKSDK